MKNIRKVITVPLGELIAALYDETEKVMKKKRLQTLLVALALLDLRRRVVKSPGIGGFKNAKTAA